MHPTSLTGRKYWWESPKNEAHDKVATAFASLDEQNSSRIQSDLDNLRIYGNQAITGLTNRPLALQRNRITWNVVAQCIDTLVSKIGKSKPRPKFMPNGGDFSFRYKAKQLTKYTDAQFRSMNLYKIGREVFRNACWHGTGVLKLSIVDGKMEAESVIPLEIKVDAMDGFYCNPTQIGQAKPITRDLLLAKYPEHRAAIQSATLTQQTWMPNEYLSDTLTVREAWILGPGDEPGRHVICIDGATLLDEDYTPKDFPFIFFRWHKRALGFWGAGVSEQLQGIQLEINQILQTIQRSFYMLGNPYIIVDQRAEIPTDHINNRIGNIIRTRHGAPQVVSPQVIHPEQFRHLETLYRRSFEIVGLSQLSVASQKPPGLNSGVAIREHHDIESERFQEVGLNLEEFYMEVAHKVISLSKQISEERGNFRVDLNDVSLADKIKWSDIDMEKDQYELGLYPVSLLPTKPEGRLARVQDLIQAGMIDASEGKELLDVPDLERYTDIDAAARDLQRKQVDRMLEEGIYSTPENFDDLKYGLSYARLAYNRAKVEEIYPEEHLDLVRRYMSEIDSMLQPPEPVAPPPVAPVAPGLV